MHEASIYACQCSVCQAPDDHPDKQHHRRMNLLLSRMDEQQRRWYAALESTKIGHGGDVLMARITGMNAETIRRGRRELEDDLRERPAGRIRSEGAGRPRVEKKIPPSSRT